MATSAAGRHQLQVELLRVHTDLHENELSSLATRGRAEPGAGGEPADAPGLTRRDVSVSAATSAAGRHQLQVELLGAYTGLHEIEDSELEAHGCAEVEVGGQEARARWTAARARSHPHGRPKPGTAQGTKIGLRGALGRTTICFECACLVHFEAARRQAKACGRTTFVAGDGCAGASCTHGHSQPKRYARTQVKMASALLDGTRTLVLWPATTRARVGPWAVPPEIARRVARAVLARPAHSVHAPPHCRM